MKGEENMPKIYAFADEASSMIDFQIAALRRNHLQGLEIRNVDGVNVSDISLEKASEVRKKLDDAELTTWAIGSPIGKIELTEDFEAHLQKLARTIEIAHVLGATNIRGFSFYLPTGVSPDDARSLVLNRMNQMTSMCQEAGVQFCHENEKGIYGDTAARCLDLYRNVPGLCGVFDPANFIQCGQDTAEAWKLLKPYIRYLHIKDACHDGRVVPAGYGAGHVAEIVNDYLASGGSVLTLEPHLMLFDGLSNLERSGEDRKIGSFAYQSQDEAFDAAAAAFRAILPSIERSFPL